jgi:hypothetical protein
MTPSGIALGLATTLAAAGSTGAQGPNLARVAQPTPREPLHFTVDSRHRIYDVPVSFAFATTIWLPVDCYEAVVGDPDWFTIAYNPKRKANRRYVLTPNEDRPGAETSVSFDCDEGVQVVLRVQQGPPEKAVLAVEFALNPEETERVRRAVKQERDRAAKHLRRELEVNTARVQKQHEQELALGMLSRFRTDDDREYGRQDFFVVRTFRQVVIGDRGVILLAMKNITDNDVTIQSIEAFDEDSGDALKNSTLFMKNRRVAADTESFAAVHFDATDALETVKLVVREKGPRVIEITDIDM